MTRLVFALAMVLCADPALAQAGRPAFMLGPYAFDAALLPVAAEVEQSPAPVAQHVETEYAASTVAEVTPYVKVLTVDGVAVAGASTCRQVGANVVCRWTLPTLLSNAPHDVLVTSTLNSVTAEVRATIDPSKGPKPSGAPRVLITITLP